MNVTLRPNRDLLDPNFESYKLSLDKIPVEVRKLKDQIYYKPLECLESKQHVQAFSHHNCLYGDPHFPGHSYYINSNGSVCCLSIPGKGDEICPAVPLFTFTNWNDCKSRGQPSLSFPSNTLVAVCDGNGMLWLLETGSPREDATWKVVLQEKLPQQCSNTQLLDSLVADSSCHCVLASVVDRPSDLQLTGKSSYVTFIDWLTFNRCAENSKWIQTRHCRFAGFSFPDYLSLVKDATALHICSEKSFSAIFDSSDATVASRLSRNLAQTSMEIGSSQVSLMSTTSDTPAVEFPIQWSQSEPTSDDESGMIHVTFELDFDLPLLGDKVDPNAVKIEIFPTEVVETNPQTLRVTVSTEADKIKRSVGPTLVLIEHHLYGFVDAKPTWTVDRQTKCLEVHLSKKHTLHWPRLLHDSELDRKRVKRSGTELSASEVEGIQEGPQSSTTPNATLKPAFNVEQLEDVDFPADDSEDDMVLQRFSHKGLEITHRASLSGHQWLLNVQMNRSENWTSTAAICLRHDVDGIIWLPTMESTPKGAQWAHVATLQAFGYVLASKRDHRFVSCPLLSNGKPVSFVAVADGTKHVYIYWQPLEKCPFADKGTELRRRIRNSENGGAGDRFVKVHTAWQHVVNIPSDESILGFVTFEEPYPCCILCTEAQLFFLPLHG